MRALRLDFVGPVKGPTGLTDGSIRLPSYIARTGVQVYEYEDGTISREYRPPEEVFARDSLESWRALALTVGHPQEPVAPHNWSDLAVGHVGDVVAKDGQFVAADVVIKDQETIALVAGGELVELSCGYMVEVDFTPGVTPEGEPYDAIQRNIVGNHVALGPKDWGRAGNEVRLYADSKASGKGAVHRAYPHDERDDMRTDEKKPVATEQPRKDSEGTATPVNTVTREEYDRVCAECDGLKAKLAALSNLAPAAPVSSVDAAEVARKVNLRVSATKIDSNLDTTKSDRDVMVAAIIASGLATKLDGKSDAYLEVLFDMAVDGAKSSTTKRTAETEAIVDIATKVDSNAGEGRAEAAKRKMREKTGNAWKGGK